MTTLLIKHIACGQAFFSGVGLLVVAVILVTRDRRRTATIAWAIGLFLIAVSSTPLPVAYYLTAGLLSVAWMYSVRRRAVAAAPVDRPSQEGLDPTRSRPSPGVKLTTAFLGVWLIGLALELPYHVMPSIPPAAALRLTIYADSVTAGMGEHEAVTWPQLLAEAHEIEVADHSRMGATAKSAAVLAERQPPESGIVLLEIGGNDILGSTTVPEFEQALDTLCRNVTGRRRQVVMLELPLPPLLNRYGQVQRQVAERHNVLLIPKRFLLDVLLSDATTLDSIHLSQAGHQKMAERVWTLLRPSLENSGQP